MGKRIIPHKSGSSQSPSLDHRNVTRMLLRNAVGMDKLRYIISSSFVRHTVVDGVKQYSIIDAIDIFTDTTNDPRRYWNDKKKVLIGSNTELSETIGRLKLLASDGKMRLTDVAPLWVLLGIISKLDTESSNNLTNAIFKGVANAVDNAALRYRAMNIENGLEWAADTIHNDMKKLTPINDSDLEWWQK